MALPPRPRTCPSCAGDMRGHLTAFVFLCSLCGTWADGDGRERPPPRPEEIKVPAEVREILRRLEGESDT